MAGVVVTRDEDAGGPLARLLRRTGAEVLLWSTVRTAPPEDPAPLEAAVRGLDAFDWVVFTSRRSVAALAGVGAVPPGSLRVAAVGEGTAEALAAAGWRAAVVPETQTGAALVEALAAAGVGPGDRVLFPASEIARDTVPDGLERLGATVVRVVAYRTLPAELDRDRCRAALDGGWVDVITFTSPSTVENLAAALGGPLFQRLARDVPAVTIGPTTADAARRAGFADVAVAEPHSLEGLADRVAALAARET